MSCGWAKEYGSLKGIAGLSRDWLRLMIWLPEAAGANFQAIWDETQLHDDAALWPLL